MKKRITIPEVVKMLLPIFMVVVFCLTRHPLRVLADEPNLKLYAKAAVLMDADSGRVLYDLCGDEQLPMASTTKIMTLIVTLENADPEDTVMVSSYAASMPQVHLGIRSGEQYRLKDLMYSLMLESHNDSAVAIAEHVGGSVEHFAELMNRKAAEIGCRNTYYITPNGLDAAEDGRIHSTTARDLAILGCEILNKHVEITEYTKLTYGKFQHTSTGKGETEMVSSNNLTRGKFYTESDGLIVGSNSEDGYAMVATVSDGKTRSVAVIVGAKDENYRAAEIKKLLEYGLSGFEYRKIETAGTFVRKINIKDGESKKIKTEAAADFSVLLNKNDFDKIERKVEITKTVKAPAQKGQVVGEVIYKIGDRELGRVDIVLSEDMDKAGWFTLLIRRILAFFGLE